MATKVTVTKKERAALGYVQGLVELMNTATTKEYVKHCETLASFIKKVDERAIKPQSTSLGYAAFWAVCYGVMQTKVASLKQADPVYYAKMAHQIKVANITEEDAVIIAQNALAVPFPPVKHIDWIVNRIPQLLSTKAEVKHADRPAYFGRDED